MKLTDLKDHQVAALKNGGGVIVDGNVVGIGDFEDGHTLTPQTIDASMEIAKAKAEIDALKAEVSALSSKGGGDNAELLEALIPDSESGLKALSKEKVEGIAAYKGIETDGKDKAALVAELLSAQGGN